MRRCLTTRCSGPGRGVCRPSGACLRVLGPGAAVLAAELQRWAEQTMLNASRILLLISLAIAVSGMGCGLPKNDAYLHTSDLALEISVSASTVQAGQRLPAQLTLINRGQLPVKAHIRTGSPFFTFYGALKLIGGLKAVELATPNQTVVLHPNVPFRWQEEIVVLASESGPEELQMEVPIYNIRACNQFGCQRDAIESNRLPLNVKK